MERPAPADVQLRPLRQDEYEAWAEASSESYVRDLVAHAGLDEATARRKLASDQAAAWPPDASTPAHTILVIEEAGRAVGAVWFAWREWLGEPRAFLYEIRVDDAEQGRGIGRRAMELLEEEVRRAGLGRIELNVFGGNDRARGLYRALGYREVGVTMGKDLR